MGVLGMPTTACPAGNMGWIPTVGNRAKTSDLRAREPASAGSESPGNLEIRAHHMTACPADSHFSFNLEGETKGNFLTLMPKFFHLLFIAV